MPRLNLRAAREKAHLSQAELATKVGVARKTVVAWEAGTQTPQPLMCRQLETALNRKGDEHLFDIVPDETDKTQTPLSCADVHTGDTLDSSDPYTDVQEEESTDMDPNRRRLTTTIATGAIAAAGITLVNNIQIITTPFATPEESIAQARIAVDDAWEWMNQGNYRKVERTLNAYAPTLARFANTISPFQAQAARIMVEVKILQIILAKHRLDYVNCKTYCLQLPEYAQFSGDSTILAVALDWQGNTYDAIEDSSHKSAPILHDALSYAGNDALLRSAIYSDLSGAYSQDYTQDDYERKAREYSELAHETFPTHPELSTVYRCVGFSDSELYHFDGITYLNLARHLSNQDYAQMAYKTFESSLSKKALSQGYLARLLVNKADASSALDRMDECVSCLTDAYSIAIKLKSLRTFTQIDDVLSRVPDNRKRETPITKLQGEVANALIVARS